MRPRPARRVAAVLAAGALLPAGVLVPAGCGSGTRPDPGLGGTNGASLPQDHEDARAQLAGRAAAAKDRRYVAGYTLTVSGRAARTVLVTVAADKTWRVDVPGAALGGTVDLAVAGRPDGLYQCVLAATATTTNACVRVAGPGGALPAAVDPRVEHAFTDWLDVLTDRQAAISVTAAQPLPGSRGTCYSVEPSAVSLVSAIDAGVYCYDADGTLTGLRTGFGTLLLGTTVAAAPASVTLPGPVLAGTPLPIASPPAPPPPASVPRPSRR